MTEDMTDIGHFDIGDDAVVSIWSLGSLESPESFLDCREYMDAENMQEI